MGELEATQFSTTTKLKGKTTFVMGASSFGGDATVRGQFGIQKHADDYFSGYDRVHSFIANGYGRSRKMADVASKYLGGTTFNYDQQLELLTSFTGKDLLKARLRTGNFQSSAFGFNASTGIPNAFGGYKYGGRFRFVNSLEDYVGLYRNEYKTPSSMEAAFEEGTVGNSIVLDRLFYQFPLGNDFTITVGGIVRQDDMLAVWPSAYPADTVLDFFTYAGAPGTYLSLIHI